MPMLYDGKRYGLSHGTAAILKSEGRCEKYDAD
jgi:hypothetical protein